MESEGERENKSHITSHHLVFCTTMLDSHPSSMLARHDTIVLCHSGELKDAESIFNSLGAGYCYNAAISACEKGLRSI